MERVAEWVSRRRKLLGFERQKDLEIRSSLSLSTIQGIEAKGDILKRERATRRLLAYALRVSEEDMIAFAKGEISEDQIREEGRDEVRNYLKRLNEENDQPRIELLDSLTRHSMGRIAKMIITRLTTGAPPQRAALADVLSGQKTAAGDEGVDFVELDSPGAPAAAAAKPKRQHRGSHR